MHPATNQIMSLLGCLKSVTSNAANSINNMSPPIASAFHMLGSEIDLLKDNLAVTLRIEYTQRIVRKLGLKEHTDSDIAGIQQVTKLIETYLQHHTLIDEQKTPLVVEHTDWTMTIMLHGNHWWYKTMVYDEYWYCDMEAVALVSYLPIDWVMETIEAFKERVGFYPEPNKDQMMTGVLSTLESLSTTLPHRVIDEDDYYSSQSKFYRRGRQLWTEPRWSEHYVLSKSRDISEEYTMQLFYKPAEDSTELVVISPCSKFAFYRNEEGVWACDAPTEIFSGYYLKQLNEHYQRYANT